MIVSHQHKYLFIEVPHTAWMAFQFTQRPDTDFAAYFRKYHRLSYSDSVCRDARQYGKFLLRFEHLQEDFAEVLRQIGIEHKGPLPHVNKTATKNAHFLSYYTPDIIEQAIRVFGPCMEEWGYELPPEWNSASIPLMSRLNYRMVSLFRDFYWNHVKWNPRFYGRLASI